MPKSINKAILVGNVGRDPQLQYVGSGTALAKFSMATNERYKDKNGDLQERTEWHRLVAWGRTAEVIGEYVHKGSKLYIEGRLRTSSWEDNQSGQTRYATEIVVLELVFCGDARSGNNGHNGTQHAPADPPPGSSSEHSWHTEAQEPEEFAHAGSVPDDIPF